MKGSNELFDWENFWNLVGTSFVLIILVAALTVVMKWIFADNIVQYCLIERYTYDSDAKGYYKLEGQVDWRPNQTLGRFPTFDEAIEAAKKVNCPLNIKH